MNLAHAHIHRCIESLLAVVAMVTKLSLHVCEPLGGAADSRLRRQLQTRSGPVEIQRIHLHRDRERERERECEKELNLTQYADIC